MNAHAQLALAAALFLFGCSDPAPADPKAPDPIPIELRDRVDEAVADGFSGSILVTANGERLLTEAHGFAHREDETPNTAETAFDVGSILKTFTAIALFKLVEDGELAPTDTLGELFPDVPEDKAGITLLEILQHQAGFDEYHDTTGDFEAMTRLEARERILSQTLLFEPGEDEAYSNSGYTLLADVIETVSGRSYADFVRDELFEPAGMSSSGFYSEPIWQSVDTAIGYDASTFGDNDPAGWPYTWALVGNGGLVTTVGDLDLWISALFGGRILGGETLDLVREELLAGGAATVGGELIYGEAGAGDYGLGGAVIYAPDSDTRVIIATNTFEVVDVEELAVDLALLCLDAEATAER